jgi:hypothetical protein
VWGEKGDGLGMEGGGWRGRVEGEGKGTGRGGEGKGRGAREVVREAGGVTASRALCCSTRRNLAISLCPSMAARALFCALATSSTGAALGAGIATLAGLTGATAFWAHES